MLTFARRWLYDHQLLVMRERDLRALIVAAIRQYEATLARTIQADVDTALLEHWQQAVAQPRESSLTTQTWLWAPPAKHSTVQIDAMLERIELLYELQVQHHLREMPDDVLRRYARRLASRSPSAGQLISEPGRTIEVACFLRYCLLTNTDRLLLMVRRRVADLWRRASQDAKQVLIHWADLYRKLLSSHGISMSAAETARMMPQSNPNSVRQAMRWASDERRLSDAYAAVLAYMHRHPITTTWGRADLASSDMMSLETGKRV